ncbi:MAG: type II toxin-antitoxin system VapC family toxin [Chloroflexota bacterium]|nr:type II toxin-antitoxin system VapC family toxin [Chloroflexota bacterium]
MTTYFLDTSALVKHYRSEPGSERIDALFAETESTRIISELTIVEFASAFRRLTNRGEIDDVAMNHALRRFTADTTDNLVVVEFRSDVIKIARDTVLQHSLRALDALQLAAVLSATRRSPVFVSADANLLSAAQVNGLETVNPLD